MQNTNINIWIAYLWQHREIQQSTTYEMTDKTVFVVLTLDCRCVDQAEKEEIETWYQVQSSYVPINAMTSDYNNMSWLFHNLRLTHSG